MEGSGTYSHERSRKNKPFQQPPTPSSAIKIGGREEQEKEIHTHKNQTHNHTTRAPKEKQTITNVKKRKHEDKLDAAYSTEQAIQHEDGKEDTKEYT